MSDAQQTKEDVTPVEVMAKDYMSWSKHELCRALAVRVNELKQLRTQLIEAQQLAVRQGNQLRRARSDMECNDHLNARAIFGEPQS